ncbi:MAG: MazG nucleotide pyrophosphohydrolase domain-containing protein [Colwellia sp.]
MNINEMAEKNYLWVEEMGWHNKTVLEALALVASEVGEAINECRHEKPTEAFGEELADVILRVLDIAHWQGIDIEKKILDKMDKNTLRGTRGRLK